MNRYIGVLSVLTLMLSCNNKVDNSKLYIPNGYSLVERIDNSINPNDMLKNIDYIKSLTEKSQQIITILYKINDPDGYSNLRGTPGGPIIMKVYDSERFVIIGEKDNHKQVKLNDGTIGYIHNSRVKESGEVLNVTF